MIIFKEKHSRVRHFFTDKKGDVVLIQAPNAELYTVGVFWLVSIFTADRLSEIFYYLFLIALFVWATKELTHGSSAFRKLLGLLTIIYILIKLYFIYI
jgi:hypothetical protein